MKRLTLSLMALCIFMVPDTRATELQGLWKVISVKNLATGKSESPHRQWHMFSASHHMIILAGENRKKVQKSFYDMTAEEVMSQMPVGAALYRYRIQRDKLIRTNVVALSAYYEEKTFETEFQLSGDTLLLRDSHPADGQRREWTLQRVE